MDTIQEYDASGPPLTDTHKSNYIAATRKKKRSDQYSDTDVNDVWSLERPQDKCVGFTIGI